MKRTILLASLLLGAGSLSHAAAGEPANTSLRSAGRSCISISGTIEDGMTMTGYSSPTSFGFQKCSSLMSTVTCINGFLNGPDLYSSCVDIGN